MYSNEAEKANKDIYDDFKLIFFCLYGLYKYKDMSALQG